MKKIKVLQIGLSHSCGGIETFLINYLKEIDKEKVEMDFINVFESAKKEWFYSEISSNAVIYDFPNYRNHPIKFIKELKKLQSEKHYDIVHYNAASAVYLVPLIAAKISGVKRIIMHGHNNSSDKGIIKTILHKLCKIFVPLFANNFFACSYSAGEWFFNKKILKSNDFKVIKNPVDIKLFSFDSLERANVRKEFDISDNTKIIGHVGSFKNVKNHDFLIDFFNEYQKNHDNVKLMLVGDGILFSKIQQKVQKLGLSNKVIFTGSRSDVYRLINAFDVFVFPSKCEGLGTVLIEAQANGLSCVVSDTIPFEACVSDNYIKLSLNDSLDVWCNALDTIKSDRNFDNNSSLFDIANCARELENFYTSIYKIKLCHFVYGIKNGGVEKVLTSYFSNMDLNDYDLHIVTQGESDLVNLNEFENLGFKIHNVTRKADSLFKNFMDIFKVLKKYNFDIVHCHMSNTNFFSLFYSWLAGVKVRISHSHNAKVKMSFLLKILSKMSMIFDTHRVACSLDAAEWLFGSSKEVYILKNAINISRFSYDVALRDSIRKELGILNDEIVIGHIGRFEEQKNHKFLISLFNNIYKVDNNYKLILIGIGDLMDEIKEYVSSLPCSKNVIFLGSRSDVPDLLQAIDLFLFPSLYEGLGIVLIEAQTVGIPCFSSKNVPLEVKITDDFEFLDLDIDLWKDTVLKKKINKREIQYNLISKAGYNIEFAAKDLDNYYKKL